MWEKDSKAKTWSVATLDEIIGKWKPERMMNFPKRKKKTFKLKYITTFSLILIGYHVQCSWISSRDRTPLRPYTLWGWYQVDSGVVLSRLCKGDGESKARSLRLSRQNIIKVVEVHLETTNGVFLV